jgi:hypothetical protein
MPFAPGPFPQTAGAIACSTTSTETRRNNKRIPLTAVDVVANGKKARPRRRPGHEPPAAPVHFDPGRTLSTDSEEDADDQPF